jgi:hypothetical protein
MEWWISGLMEWGELTIDRLTAEVHGTQAG